MSKQGVILLNLGSPDSTSTPDVRNYLREFLMDGRVLDIPYLIRWLIVHCFILPRRPQQSAEAYQNVWTDKGSPLIVTSFKQQKALQEKLDIPVALGMRYGNPSTEAAIDELIDKGVDDLLIIPLYPHYAMSSYETAVVYLNKILKKKKVSMRTRLLPPFYKDETYISALVESAKPYLENSDFDRLIFSFHGIPERHILKSDTTKSHCFKSEDCCQNCNPAHATCYRHQCTQTVQAFVDKMGLPKEKYFLSFQSRLGRDPWLQPYTDKTIENHAENGYKKVKVICPAFTTDCLETLEEIAMEGKEIFEEAGGEHFEHIPCLNENENFIQFLAGKVHAWQNGAYDAVDTKDPVILGTQSFSKI